MGNWVVLELTSRSDGEDPDVLTRAILGTLKNPGAEVFVPAAVTQVGEDRVIHYLVEGYAFVRDPGRRLKNLENSRYVQSVLSGSVENSDIERMRVQIQREVDQGIGVGDTVQIVSGPYRNLTATVIEEIPEEKSVQVYVKLRSKQSIVTLPRSFLQVVTRTPLSGLFGRLTTIKVWVRRAKPIILWSGSDIQRLKTSLHRFERFEEWMAKDIRPLLWFLEGKLVSSTALGAARHFEVQNTDRPFLLGLQLRKTETLTRWAERSWTAWTLKWFFAGKTVKQRVLDRIQAKLVELYWFEDVMDRMDQVEAKLEHIAHRMAKRRKEGGGKVIQNVLVDGHNLAFRCFYAPGMSELADEKGRPTGVILGFLQSLGALRRKFPEARLYVSWDGSSNRRKTVYADYKANRPERGQGKPSFDQLGFLREVLPKLGIWQVYNPEEEADDVIATLVQRALKDQHNVIYSTDKDLLALVTDTTLVLMPGAGSRKEVLYDPTKVADSFGVPPGDFLQFRAFCGDPSDNIPGVPRIPKKILRSLIQAHRSVEGVYKSGLTGLTEGQYERLRLSEPQVMLNLQLMSFVDVPVTTTDPNPDEEGVAKRLQGVGINPAPILKRLGGG